jgi:hypothetical protein
LDKVLYELSNFAYGLRFAQKLLLSFENDTPDIQKCTINPINKDSVIYILKNYVRASTSRGTELLYKLSG